MRLRFLWGGAPVAWRGAIRANGAQFSAPRPLATEPDAAASFAIVNDQIHVRAESPHASDGLDVTVTADLDTVVVVELDVDGGRRSVIEAPLRQLARETVAESIDSARRISIGRTPGDRLQIDYDRSSLVFHPGEKFSFSVRPHLIGQPGSPLKIKLQLVTQQAEQRQWTQEFDARAAVDGELADAVPVQLTMPEAEGAYEIWISAISPSIKDRLPWKKPLAERRVQLVVIGDSAPPSTHSPLTKTVEIDPANPKWWERLSGSWTLTPSLRRGGLGSGDSAKWEHPRLGALVQLSPTSDNGRQTWEAYPLPTASPGQPHLVEIEYPSDVPQSIGLAVVESGGSSGLWSVLADSGVFVPDEDADQTPTLLRHRLVYWPRSKTPLLVVSNRRQGTPAVFGKIRLLTSTPPQFAAINLPTKSTPVAYSLPPAQSSAGRDERIVAALAEHPTFLRQFSGEENLTSGPQAADSWRGFYQAGARLTEYLRFAGYNALVLGAAVDGATIYPSETLGGSPRFDAGLLSPWESDPRQKDLLEALFRLFDREKLTLIPLIDFAGPIPELEELRREETGRGGIGWVTSAGVNTTTPAPGAPRYNPLNPRVQRALVAVAHELAERYGHHPSFGGMAIQFGPGASVQLSTADGGFDDDTIQRFQRATSRKTPGAGDNRFAQRAHYLLGDARAEWLAWRADAICSLHQQMLAELKNSNDHAQLYLSLAHCWDQPAARLALQPTLPPESRPDDVLLEQGLRPELYRRLDGMLTLRPSDVSPPSSLINDAVKLEMNLATELDRLFGQCKITAASCYYPTLAGSVRLPEQHGLWETNSVDTRLWTTMTPSGDRARQRLAHSVATLDAAAVVAGGQSPPFGQEDHLRDVLLAVRQLPAKRFETVSTESQPVIIRTLSREDETYAYFVNDSPWAAMVSVGVDMPNGCRVERLGPNRPLPPLNRTADGWSWSMSLKPYDLVAVRFQAAKVRLSRPKVALGENVQLALQRRISDLGSRVSALANPSPLDVPANPGFENRDKNGIAGWTVDPASEGEATLDENSEAHSGSRSLRLNGVGRQLTVRSASFALPATGRLGVHAWVKAVKAPAETKLLLALEGDEAGKTFLRYAVLGGAEPEAVRIGARWAPYVFHVSDVPDAGVSGLHLRLELVGPGEVNIDDIKLFDLSFNEIEQVELTKLVSLANFKLQAGQVGDCARILDGYWPHYLVTHVPLTEGPSVTAQRTRRPNERARELAPVSNGKRSGMLERVREFVPRFKQKSGGKSN